MHENHRFVVQNKLIRCKNPAKPLVRAVNSSEIVGIIIVIKKKPATPCAIRDGLGKVRLLTFLLDVALFCPVSTVKVQNFCSYFTHRETGAQKQA